MLPKFKLLALVVAINSKGVKADFQLDEPVVNEDFSLEEGKEKFFGRRFRGCLKDGDSSEFIVVEVRHIECIPIPFFLSIKESCSGHGTVRLGNYDDPDHWDKSQRKSLLTGLKIEFSLVSGEGLVFNDPRDTYGVSDAKCRWTKSDYIITKHGEIWRFPKNNWELHYDAQKGTDYYGADFFRDSLPEVSCY